MMKMTDEEIKQALNECLSFEMVELMTDLKLDDVVDLLNRKDIVIEKLSGEIRGYKLAKKLDTQHYKTEINRLTDKLNSAINGQETLQEYIAKQDKEIERLKAEREKLLKECKKCGNKTRKCIGKLQKQIKQAKAEAYKEFAERLKERYFSATNFNDELREVVAVETVDNLLKEMVGEDNVQ